MAKQLDENLSMGVDIDGDGKPDLNISLKTIGMLIVGIISMAGIWFTLKSDIALAMELPEPVVSAVEFKYKDEMIYFYSNHDNIGNNSTRQSLKMRMLVYLECN